MMLLSALLLLPVALASTVTIYIHPVPHSPSEKSAVIPSPVPLAQIDYEYDASASTVGTIISYTPPKGSYSPSNLLRVGLHDPKTGSWRGVVTSAASFADEFSKQIIIHVDEKGDVYHVGFGTSKRGEKGGEEEVTAEVVRRGIGPMPVLNKPVVLNAEGKLDTAEPEKSFLQKYWWAIGLFLLIQLVMGGKE